MKSLKNINAKAGLFIVLFLFLCFNLGCWDRQEIDKLQLTKAIGIDYCPLEEEITYTSQVTRPGQIAAGEEGEESPILGPVWIPQGKGQSIFEASRNIANRSPREIFESHIQVMVIGEEMARKGISEVADFMLREREHRLINWVLVTRKEAGEILRAQTELEDSLSEEIMGIMESQLLLSTAPRVNGRNFLIPLSLPGADTLAPLVEIQEKMPTPDEEIMGESSPEKKKKYLVIQGTGVFREDKLAGYLNIPETKGLLWVKGEISRAVIIPKAPDGGQVTVYITRSKSQIEPEIKKNNIKFYIEVKTEGDIASSNIKGNISDPQVIEELEKKLANNIKQEILQAVDKSREYQSDFLHLGATLRRQEPDEWQTVKEYWRKELTEVEVEVRVIAEIRRGGLISEPLISQ
ncbi:MAG: Ger(x)C family spore germination protein [Candidatus Syntrophonatronum acetioxidans]|uniref:Ger(X)C family spore germination protein n=1 Tax=Candidatus Syntrophonatronum acetioxidans TaxID=1795816 RepID=A0A424YG39_9FIRM|nr:MAG: Ger(x)C family spore germination protein [Candidatus Syntrophonatronum acetioxidans]